MKNKVLRGTLAGLLLALAVYFLLPLAIGVHHVGMFFPAAIFLVFAWMLLRPAKLRKLLTGRTARCGAVCWPCSPQGCCA